jgi:myo-inositol 2-dehydrogenase / D-chiro-inositol 1-dehydrogenase
MNTSQRSLNRRQFLAATTAGTAAFSILTPKLAFGAEANARVTVGAVGLGGRGGWIADHVATHPGFQITAVADYFPQVAEAAGTRLKVPKERRFSGLGAYRQLLESKVDAVFLETPPYFFPSHAQAAVAAGCHVYMAKPVAVDVPGCLDILAAAKKASQQKKVFQVDFQTRTDPFHNEAIKKVHEGIIGPLALITSFYHDECFSDPPRGKTIENLLSGLAWCNDNTLGGGYLVAAGIHAVDVALWIARDVPQYAAGWSARRRAKAEGDAHDCYALSFQFKDGVIMSHTGEHIPNRSGFRSGCLAYGQKGLLEANYAGKVFIHAADDGYAGGEDKDLYANGMKRNVETFHKSIVGGTYGNPTVEPSVNATLATILGREAGARGRKLIWEELLRDKTRWEADLSGLRA